MTCQSTGTGAYCWDFNEHGFCKTCGASELPTLDKLGKWPQGTWFQQRRAAVLRRESDELSKVQS